MKQIRELWVTGCSFGFWVFLGFLIGGRLCWFGWLRSKGQENKATKGWNLQVLSTKQSLGILYIKEETRGIYIEYALCLMIIPVYVYIVFVLGKALRLRNAVVQHVYLTDFLFFLHSFWGDWWVVRAGKPFWWITKTKIVHGTKKQAAQPNGQQRSQTAAQWSSSYTYNSFTTS